MIKSIILSIESIHLINILRGDKTRELRTRIPKDFKGWVYLYCTKQTPMLVQIQDVQWQELNEHGELEWNTSEAYDIRSELDGYESIYSPLNGKVVARFWFDEYDKIYFYCDYDSAFFSIHKSNGESGIMNHIEYDQLCLTYNDLLDYKKNNDDPLYAWHIKNLNRFTEPMKLSDFYSTEKVSFTELFDVNEYLLCKINGVPYEPKEVYTYQKLIKAPRSYQYVYLNEVTS